jgi:hypothetical protein
MSQHNVVKKLWVNGKGGVMSVDMDAFSIPTANYLHSQLVPSTKWVINHNLSRYPSVTVIDSAGNEIHGNVKHISMQSVQIEFAYSFAGRASCN